MVIKEVTLTYPNLLGQKAFHHLSNEDMARIINVNRTTYESKIKSGRFVTSECAAYCRYFKKDFEFLFATEDDHRTA